MAVGIRGDDDMIDDDGHYCNYSGDYCDDVDDGIPSCEEPNVRLW